MLTFAGRQDNVAIREAAIFALGVNLLIIVLAIVSIVALVPRGKVRDRASRVTPQMRAPANGRRE
jgi:DHA2 family multidrug resistance protein-like MFS transporter